MAVQFVANQGGTTGSGTVALLFGLASTIPNGQMLVVTATSKGGTLASNTITLGGSNAGVASVGSYTANGTDIWVFRVISDGSARFNAGSTVQAGINGGTGCTLHAASFSEVDTAAPVDQVSALGGASGAGSKATWAAGDLWFMASTTAGKNSPPASSGTVIDGLSGGAGSPGNWNSTTTSYSDVSNYNFSGVSDGGTVNFRIKQAVAGPVTHPLSGTVAATSATTGSMKKVVKFSGTVAATSGTSGGFGKKFDLAGQVDATSGTTGDLSDKPNEVFAGTVAATSGVSADIDKVVQFEAGVAAVSDVFGSMEVVKAPVQFSGTVAATSSVSGDLSDKPNIPLAGTVAATSDSSGALDVRTNADFSGTVAATSGASGDVDKVVQLSTGTGSAGLPSWVPSDARLVLRAEDLALSNGAQVDVWPDASDNGVDWTRVTNPNSSISGAVPPGGPMTYLTNATPGGKPAVRFPRGDWLEHAGGRIFDGTEGEAIIVAVPQTTLTTQGGHWNFSVYTSQTSHFGYSGIIYDSFGQAARPSTASGLVAGTWLIYDAAIDATAKSAWKNNAVSYNATPGTRSFVGTERIGCGPNTIYPVQADIACVLAFPRRLTTQERDDLYTNLAAIYITGTAEWPGGSGGGIAAVSDVFGDFTVTKAPVQFSGTVAATSGTSGAMSVTAPLAGTVAATSDTTGEIVDVTVQFAGTVAASSGVTGEFSVQGALDFAGTVAASSAVTGSMNVTHLLGGQVAGTSDTFGGIANLVRSLGGTVSGVSGVSGDFDLVGKVSFAGTVAAQSGSFGGLSKVARLSGLVPVVSGSSGSMGKIVALVGTIDAVSDAFGGFGGKEKVAFAGQVVAVSDSYGALGKIVGGFSGIVRAYSNTFGNLWIAGVPDTPSPDRTETVGPDGRITYAVDDRVLVVDGETRVVIINKDDRLEVVRAQRSTTVSP